MSVHYVRLCFRAVRRDPGTSLVAVLALALGIGLTATTFSFVYGTVLRGLPFDQPDQLVYINRTNLSENIPRMPVSLLDLEDWRERQTAFEDIAGFLGIWINLSGAGVAPERRTGASITPNLFEVLRVHPIIGRNFNDEDGLPGAAKVAIIGFAVWENRYARRPEVLGETIRVDGVPRTIVGVMPESFAFPNSEDIWFPAAIDLLLTERGGGPGLLGLGRIRDNVSLGAARADLASVARQLELERPTTNRGVGVHVAPYVEEVVSKEGMGFLYTMMGAVFGVLVIACSNVANLLLARTVVRAKELAIRAALGANRVRLIAQILSESLMLALFGGILGVAVAWAGVAYINVSFVEKFSPVPFWMDITLDGSVVLFVVALIIIAALAAGLVPALQASGATMNALLKDEARGTTSLKLGKLSKALVVLTIALSCGLLVPAGLMTKSVVRLGQMTTGFATDDVFVARVPLGRNNYEDAAGRVHFYGELLRELEGKPGITAVALASALPGLGSSGSRIGIEGVVYESDRDMPAVRWAATTPGFFDVFGVGVLRGRPFQSLDNRDNERVVIVNESFARRFLEGRDQVGTRLRFGTTASDTVWRSIVGVVPDLMMNQRTGRGRVLEAPEGVYIPLTQNTTTNPAVAIRSTIPPPVLLTMVRDVVAAIDPDLPISDVGTIAEAIESENLVLRMMGWWFGSFGVAALLLASVGLYGVMAFSVSRRTGEIGVRMALGSQRSTVLKLILKDGASQLALGLLLGLGIAIALSRLVAAVLFQVEAGDLTTFASVVVTLGLTGFIACWIPARNATHVDPVQALRVE
jgi:putative ABC transport system permease protein